MFIITRDGPDRYQVVVANAAPKLVVLQSRSHITPGLKASLLRRAEPRLLHFYNIKLFVLVLLREGTLGAV